MISPLSRRRLRPTIAPFYSAPGRLCFQPCTLVDVVPSDFESSAQGGVPFPLSSAAPGVFRARCARRHQNTVATAGASEAASLALDLLADAQIHEPGHGNRIYVCGALPIPEAPSQGVARPLKDVLLHKNIDIFHL